MRVSKWVYAFLAVFVVIVVSSIVTSRKEFVSVSERYRNDEYGFSILYPGSWEVRQDWQDTVVAFISPKEGSSDTLRECVNVVVVDVEEGTVLDDYLVEEYYQELGQVGTDLEVLETSAVQVNGLDARRVVLNLRLEGHLFRYLLYVLLRGERVYVITCGSRTLAYARYEDVFERICQSIEID